MQALAGVVFDVDGTLANSEQEGHRVAFNEAFARAGLPYHWDHEEYRELLAVAGGRHRVEHFLVSVGEAPDRAAALAARLHREKTLIFGELVGEGRVPLRDGVRRLVEALRAAGTPLYVATTGNRAWVEPLLRSHFEEGTFELLLTGTEVADLKPAPDVYREVLARTGHDAGEVVAVEDSHNGLLAAHGAGLPCLVVLNEDSVGDFSSAELVVTGFGPGAEYVSGPAGPETLVDGSVVPSTLVRVAASRRGSPGASVPG